VKLSEAKVTVRASAETVDFAQDAKYTFVRVQYGSYVAFAFAKRIPTDAENPD